MFIHRFTDALLLVTEISQLLLKHYTLKTSASKRTFKLEALLWWKCKSFPRWATVPSQTKISQASTCVWKNSTKYRSPMCCLTPRSLPEGQMSPTMTAPTHLLPPASGRKRIFHNFVPSTQPTLTENKREEDNLEIQGTPPMLQLGIQEEKSKLRIQRSPPLFQKYIDLRDKRTRRLLDQKPAALNQWSYCPRAPPLLFSKAS